MEGTTEVYESSIYVQRGANSEIAVKAERHRRSLSNGFDTVTLETDLLPILLCVELLASELKSNFLQSIYLALARFEGRHDEQCDHELIN